MARLRETWGAHAVLAAAVHQSSLQAYQKTRLVGPPPAHGTEDQTKKTKEGLCAQPPHLLLVHDQRQAGLLDVGAEGRLERVQRMYSRTQREQPARQAAAEQSVLALATACQRPACAS